MPSPISANPFRNLSLAQLQKIQNDWLQCLSDLALGGKAYTFTGRSLSRADEPWIKDVLTDVASAIAYQSGGKGKQIVYAEIDTMNTWSGSPQV